MVHLKTRWGYTAYIISGCGAAAFVHSQSNDLFLLPLRAMCIAQGMLPISSAIEDKDNDVLIRCFSQDVLLWEVQSWAYHFSYQKLSSNEFHKQVRIFFLQH